MAAKRGDAGGKLMAGLAGAGAAYFTRKALTFAWKKATGKSPPTGPEDRDAPLGEALAWAMVIGAGVAATRLLAIRAASRPAKSRPTE